MVTMMYAEEEGDMAADLTAKSNNNNERVKRVNDDNNEVSDISSSIDLSTKRRKTEPMEVTLDLSMPSNNGNANTNNSAAQPQSSGTNRRTQQLSHPQHIRNISVNHWSSSESASPAEVNNSDDDSQNATNGHLNGQIVSDDSVSRNDDDDMPLPPSPKLKVLTKEEIKQKEKLMRRLKQNLRNEEMKLVLLKKLRQSQLMKENIVSNLSVAANSSSSLIQPTAKTNSSQLKNGPSNMSSSLLSSSAHMRPVSQSKGLSVLNPPLSRNQSIAHGPIGPPPLGLGGQRNNNNAAHHQSLRSGPLSSLNRTPVTTPPNVVLGYSIPELRAQQNNSHSQSQNQMSLSSNGSPGPSSCETPAQRQAAAKLALRKQLEKTLLQIPPPKPPPPEMHFIPNANNQEFIYYLGLETVVDFLTDSPNQNRPPPDPFECVQCGTDFTPVWKWQDRMDPNRDRPAVICESCVTSNIKKALKAEHTNRLKTAFVKALQQEQEIEQRIASGATSPPLTSLSPPPPQSGYGAHQSGAVSSSHSLLPQAPPAHSSMPRLNGSAAAAAVASSAALLQQMPKLSAAHQSLFAAQAQQLHQLAQSLPQPQPAHAAHMLPFAPLLAAQAYSYSMLGKSAGVPSTDLHRQYLLDMIPPRSLPQGSINWKT